VQAKQKVVFKDILIGVSIFTGLTWSFWYHSDMSFVMGAVLAGLLTPALWLFKLISKEFSK
jgi:hypothetical protein